MIFMNYVNSSKVTLNIKKKQCLLIFSDIFVSSYAIFISLTQFLIKFLNGMGIASVRSLYTMPHFSSNQQI